MSETPKLEIGRTAPKPLLGPQEVVTLDGTPITDEENETAAVLIRCMREGWGFARWTGADSDNTETICQVEAHHSFVSRPTPTEAYRAATRDEES